MKTVVIHADKIIGNIKKLNGIGGGPRSSMFTFNAVREFREAGIPFGRTHDIEYPLGSGEFVDIHNIFRDFEKNPEDPKAYNFTMTDAYLSAMEEAGTRPFYRLGTSIEHQKIKLYTYPPKDFHKWAQICSHIVSHYNEGWADGFHMGIEYWEIWNEPDIPQCWLGTPEEYFNLYDVTSVLLKKEHPDIQVGGPTVTSPYVDMAESFLAHLRDSGAPLDFFSWHGYSHTPQKAKALAEQASRLLRKYGFDKTKSICDEWNYICEWGKNVDASMKLHKTAFGASYTASILSAFQNSDIDISILYDGQLLGESVWNSCFSPAPMDIHAGERGVRCEKPYYTFKAWGELARAGQQLEAESDCPDIYITAARSEKEVKVLVTCFNDDASYNQKPPEDRDVLFLLDGADCTDITASVTDDEKNFEKLSLPKPVLHLKGNETTAMLTFRLKN